MELSGTQVRYEIVATANPTSVHVNGAAAIGSQMTTFVYAVPPTQAYSLALVIYDGDTLTLNTSTGAVTGTVAGQNQVETATAAGTITGTGNASVTITSALITGSPITVDVPVVSGDTASVWAGKVRSALAALPAITDHYTVGGTTTSITLTTLEKLPNDTSLNVATDNGTCTGITPAATSADTTAGIGNSRAYRITGQAWDQTDFEGKPLPTMTGVCSVLVKTSVSDGGAVFATSPSPKGEALKDEGIDLSASKDGTHAWSNMDVAFEAAGGNAVVYIDIQAI